MRRFPVSGGEMARTTTDSPPPACADRLRRAAGAVLVAGAAIVALGAGSGPARAAEPLPGSAMLPVQSGGSRGAPSSASGDLTRYNSSIVRLDAKVPSDATSAQSLGADRTGTGIILDDRTVLTIGYLTLEADAVLVTTASGKRIPASVWCAPFCLLTASRWPSGIRTASARSSGC
jgi:hypothetical protein